MFCPYCKKEIEDDSLFCSYCGEKIETPVVLQGPFLMQRPMVQTGVHNKNWWILKTS